MEIIRYVRLERKIFGSGNQYGSNGIKNENICYDVSEEQYEKIKEILESSK